MMNSLPMNTAKPNFDAIFVFILYSFQFYRNQFFSETGAKLEASCLLASLLEAFLLALLLEIYCQPCILIGFAVRGPLQTLRFYWPR